MKIVLQASDFILAYSGWLLTMVLMALPICWFFRSRRLLTLPAGLLGLCVWALGNVVLDISWLKVVVLAQDASGWGRTVLQSRLVFDCWAVALGFVLSYAFEWVYRSLEQSQRVA